MIRPKVALNHFALNPKNFLQMLINLPFYCKFALQWPNKYPDLINKRPPKLSLLQPGLVLKLELGLHQSDMQS